MNFICLAIAITSLAVALVSLRTALADRKKLAAVSADPVGSWRAEDPVAVRGLANLELHAAGMPRLTG